MSRNLLCMVGLHKWESWFCRKDGDIFTGRVCKRCPKIQWSRETYVRQYYKTYGDVPMTDKQLESMRKGGYK